MRYFCTYNPINMNFFCDSRLICMCAGRMLQLLLIHISEYCILDRVNVERLLGKASGHVCSIPQVTIIFFFSTVLFLFIFYWCLRIIILWEKKIIKSISVIVHNLNIATIVSAVYSILYFESIVDSRCYGLWRLYH